MFLSFVRTVRNVNVLIGNVNIPTLSDIVRLPKLKIVDDKVAGYGRLCRQ